MKPVLSFLSSENRRRILTGEEKRVDAADDGPRAGRCGLKMMTAQLDGGCRDAPSVSATVMREVLRDLGLHPTLLRRVGASGDKDEYALPLFGLPVCDVLHMEYGYAATVNRPYQRYVHTYCSKIQMGLGLLLLPLRQQRRRCEPSDVVRSAFSFRHAIPCGVSSSLDSEVGL